ncbi:MAG: hypothetical protein ACYTHJ_09050 [Planctomycetota bacterium]|jgi:hypothetical protein
MQWTTSPRLTHRLTILLPILAAAATGPAGTVFGQAELAYSNTASDTFFPPGVDRRIADDLFLDNDCSCALSRYEFTVGGDGDGTGEGFTVEYGLYNGCPSSGGQLIVGTEGVAEIPDDGQHVVVHVPTGPISLQANIWLAVEFSRNGAGWYTGAEPDIGFSTDIYDFPTFPCIATFNGTPLYASFLADVYCEPTGSPPVDAPDPPDGAEGQPTGNTILRWNQFGETATAPVDVADDAPAEPVTPDNFEDATVHPDDFFRDWQAAIDAGEVEDPRNKKLPEPAPITWPGGVAGVSVPPVTNEDIFFFEDTEDLIATSNFSNGTLFNIMADATNALIAEHGDNFDFVGFWVNFAPHHQIGAAFYLGLENQVSGIGLNNFNNRSGFGVIGENVEGWVMMWNQANWSLGETGGGAFTQLVLGQEFEHRWGMFLNGISGNRPLQGPNGSCGRSAHWNFRVDAQGSGMEVAEWVGSSPAMRTGGTLQYNKDIPNGVFSYPDLYLMGYVSGPEMDANSSELRYMDDNTNCSSTYDGPISNWGSFDIVASNGERSPTSFFAQKHFATGWVMIHRPGLLPTTSQLNRVSSMLNTWNEVYIRSTLGRGTMSNVLTPVTQPDLCATVYDVRLDTVDPPDEIICENIVEPFCDPGDLADETTYFWQVSASQVENVTEGPVWSFTTSCGVSGHSPESCLIDARQTSPVDDAASPQGWDTVTFTFECQVAAVFAEDFEVTVDSGEPPAIASLTIDGSEVTVQLSEPIPPGQWTCINHINSDVGVCLGSLPGDVDSSRNVSFDDLLIELFAIDDIVQLPERSTDIDRNGELGPEDLLRIIDLLNGGGVYDDWLLETLDTCPTN